MAWARCGLKRREIAATIMLESNCMVAKIESEP
jgi:hypothetical protein